MVSSLYIDNKIVRILESVEIDIDHSILMPQISQTNFRLTRDLEEPKALESTVRK